MHTCETRFLEIVSQGRDAGPGLLGEIVLTSLNQMATPLIRYKIGDMGVLDPGRCSCGRGLPVLREIVGRVQDFLVGSDGLYVYGGYFPHTFRNWPEIRRYQVRQPDRSHLEVRFVLRCPVDSGWIEMVRGEIQSRFGPGVAVSVALVDEIELTAAGKHRSIISEVKPDFS
jgi:phenylacetate-CoA ligase